MTDETVVRTSKQLTDRELYLLTECMEWQSCNHLGCKARREIDRLREALLSGEQSAHETSEPLAETTAKHWLGELLAIIHRDGGQYEAKHGSIVATQDAIKIVHVLRGDRNCKVCDGLGYSVGLSKRVPCDECEGTGLALLAEHATPEKA